MAKGVLELNLRQSSFVKLIPNFENTLSRFVSLNTIQSHPILKL
jgi:hypothetical protein